MKFDVRKLINSYRLYKTIWKIFDKNATRKSGMSSIYLGIEPGHQHSKQIDTQSCTDCDTINNPHHLMTKANIKLTMVLFKKKGITSKTVPRWFRTKTSPKLSSPAANTVHFSTHVACFSPKGFSIKGLTTSLRKMQDNEFKTVDSVL